MANYRSIPKQYRAVTSSVDEQRLTNTLQTLDAKYKNNVNQVYGAINQVASIDLLRDSDKEYLHNNLKSVLDLIDQTDDIDFSKGNVGGELQGYIASAIDKNVLKHAGIAAKYKNFEGNLAELKEKKPELYNEGNRQDALKQAGFYDYMANETDNVNSLNYTNFVDVNEKMLKNIKTMKDLKPDETVEFLNPNTGAYEKKKISTLNKTEWQRVIQTSFDDNDRAQLAINGRQFYEYNDQDAIADLEGRRTQLSSKYDSEIESLKAQKVSSPDEITRNQYQSRIDYLEKEKTASLTTLDTGAKTAGAIGSFLTQRHMSIDMANIMSKETILSNKIDYAYLNQKAKYLKSVEELKAQEVSDINTGITTKAKPVGLEGLDVRSAFETQKLQAATETRDLLKQTYDKIKNQNYNNTTIGAEIDALESQTIKEYTEEFGQAPDEFTLHRLVVDKADHLLDAQSKYELNTSLLKTEQYFNAEREAEQKTVNNILTKQSKKLFNKTFTEQPQMVMFDKEGAQTTYGEFLTKNKITNEASFISFLNSDTDEAKIYKANAALQSLSLHQQRQQGSLTTLPSTFQKNIQEGKYKYDPAIEEALNEEEKKLYNYSVGVLEKLMPENKIKSIIGATTQFSGEGQRFSGNPSAVISNEGINFEEDFKEEYEKILNLESGRIPGMNVLIVDPQIDKGAPTNSLYKELKSATSQDFDKTRAFEVVDNNDNTITIYQQKSKQVTDSSKDEQTTLKGEFISQDINKNDISPNNYPQLYKRLESQQSSSEIDFFKKSGFEKENMGFYEDSANQAQGLVDLFGNNQEIIQQASKSTASPYIKRNLQRVLQNKEGANQFYQIVDKSIEQANKFNVSLSTSDSGGYSQIQIKMKTKKHTEQNPDYEILYTQPIDTGSNELSKVLHGAPQVMITTLLMQAGRQFGQDGNVTLANKIANNLD